MLKSFFNVLARFKRFEIWRILGGYVGWLKVNLVVLVILIDVITFQGGFVPEIGDVWRLMRT